jgi:hypothetical protein
VATQTWDCAAQNVDRQSPPARHALPVAHAGHEPPQSTSVSLPFLTPSVHDGSAVRSGGGARSGAGATSSPPSGAVDGT